MYHPVLRKRLMIASSLNKDHHKTCIRLTHLTLKIMIHLEEKGMSLQIFRLKIQFLALALIRKKTEIYLLNLITKAIAVKSTATLIAKINQS